MCVRARTRTCTCMCMFVKAREQPQVSFLSPSFCCFEMRSLTDLELSKQAKQTGQ